MRPARPVVRLVYRPGGHPPLLQGSRGQMALVDWMTLDFVSLFCAKELFNTPVSDVWSGQRVIDGAAR